MEFEPLERIKSVALELKLLKCINDGEMYPYALLKDFEESRFGRFKVTKSDIYNAIASLEKKRYIKIAKRKGAKKYYRITNEGKYVLKESKKILLQTLHEISKIL